MIGFLTARTAGEDSDVLAAFRQAMKDGLHRELNVAIAYRLAENDYAECRARSGIGPATAGCDCGFRGCRNMGGQSSDRDNPIVFATVPPARFSRAQSPRIARAAADQI
jgi:hypothetical protein